MIPAATGRGTYLTRDICNNRLIITGTNAIPDDIALGVDVNSVNMSDHIEFDVPETYELAEIMARRLLEGIQLI